MAYLCSLFTEEYMNEKKNYTYHVIAVVIVAIWGVTFISTKILIGNGLSPQEIFLLRFCIAYAGIWIISPRRLMAKNWRDELWLVAGGMTGGSFYFLAENTALKYTQTNNVAFLITTAPLFTAFLSILFYKNEKASRSLFVGSIIALIGVALVVYNGSYILKLSPLGDFLTFLAALSWAFYSLIMRKVLPRYSAAFITRKIFFYGILTVLPFFIVEPFHFGLADLFQPVVLFNLLFLGVVASLICYVTWNIVLNRLGTVSASNYIYLNPLATLVGSTIVLAEEITVISLMGSALILGGVYIAEKRHI